MGVACGALGLGLAGFTPLVAGNTAPQAGMSSKSQLRIIAFGSSSTEGIGASRPSATYPAQLQLILSHVMPKGRVVEVLNRGIGGEDVDDMMKRLQKDVIKPKPDIVIWQTGSNDVLRHVPLARFETETRAGIEAMQKAGAEVILMEPQWCPMLEKAGGAGAFSDAIRRIGRDMKVAVIRRSELMRKWIAEGRMTRAQMLASDGLHMSDSGYSALARDIAPEVLRASAVAVATPVAAEAK